MITSKLLALAASVLLFAGRSAAVQCELNPCWTSFNEDCEDGSYDCSFNDSNSYLQFDRPEQHSPRLVIIDDDFKVEWRDHDKEYPVRISWHWWRRNLTADLNDENNGNEEDETDPMVGLQQLPSMKWDINITSDEPSTTLNLWRIIHEDFPNDHINMTSEEVLALVQNNGTDMVLGIYQPENPKWQDEFDDADGDYRLSDLVDWSNWFQVSGADGNYSTLKRYFQTQRGLGRKEEKKRWALGVGIGVGVGVPIITLLALFAGYKYGQKKARAPLVKSAGDATPSRVSDERTLATS